MDCSAKLLKYQNALLLTFSMYVFMALMVIRTGLNARMAAGSFSFKPQDGGPDGDIDPTASLARALLRGEDPPWDGPPWDDQLVSSSLADRLDQLYMAALALLSAAKAVAEQLRKSIRKAYELMKLADVTARSRCSQAGIVILRRPRTDAPFDDY